MPSSRSAAALSNQTCSNADFFNTIRPFRPFRRLDAVPESGWGGWLPLPALQRQGGAVTQHEFGATTMEITTVGIDLAKNVFQVHAVSRSGEVIVRRALRRRR